MDNGSTVNGKFIGGYELHEIIGTGGFGRVVRAFQPSVGREVAIKIIHPKYVNHPTFIRRFEAEAHLIARLEHPHIVPLIDYWHENDDAFIVMRWLRGGSVRKLLKSGSLEISVIAKLLDQICDALSFAHRAGIIHRDLKPDNILLDDEGNFYLSDFGIAKDLTVDTGLTPEGIIIGSTPYLTPEQIRQENLTPQGQGKLYNWLRVIAFNHVRTFSKANSPRLMPSNWKQTRPIRRSINSYIHFGKLITASKMKSNYVSSLLCLTMRFGACLPVTARLFCGA